LEAFAQPSERQRHDSGTTPLYDAHAPLNGAIGSKEWAKRRRFLACRTKVAANAAQDDLAAKLAKRRRNE
jgi:hypothetical protein